MKVAEMQAAVDQSMMATSRMIKANNSSIKMAADAGDSGLMIAMHYRARSNRTAKERDSSPILGLKKLHAWIKAKLIAMHISISNTNGNNGTDTGPSVLDLACGKGADVAACARGGASVYLGVDVVDASVWRAAAAWALEQHAACGDHHRMSARFVVADCFSPSLPAVLAPDVPYGGFDVISCQFAFHYAWSSAARAHAAVANVAALLKAGGYFIGTIPDADVILGRLRDMANGGGAGNGEVPLGFGNSVFSISFDPSAARSQIKHPYGLQYDFYLNDAVNHCPEWLVPFHELVKLCEQYGLKLVQKMKLKDFVDHNTQKNFEGDIMSFWDAVSKDEWECTSIYLAFVFQKPKQPKQ